MFSDVDLCSFCQKFVLFTAVLCSVVLCMTSVTISHVCFVSSFHSHLSLFGFVNSSLLLSLMLLLLVLLLCLLMIELVLSVDMLVGGV